MAKRNDGTAHGFKRHGKNATGYYHNGRWYGPGTHDDSQAAMQIIGICLVIILPFAVGLAFLMHYLYP